MIRGVSSIIGGFLPSVLKTRLMSLLQLRRSLTPIAERQCNICGYYGFFSRFGKPPRIDARCPQCGSLERHRLLMLAVERGEISGFEREDISILHFAPEPILEKIFRTKYPSYTTADLFVEADQQWNIEAIDVGDEMFDIIIANHVLEHVDDIRASMELSRIMKKNGIFVCQVPIIEGWDETYENDEITSDDGRLLHYGQSDHVRFYGKDFRERLGQGGLRLEIEITSIGEDVIKHGLIRGEKVFVFKKLT